VPVVWFRAVVLVVIVVLCSYFFIPSTVCGGISLIFL